MTAQAVYDRCVEIGAINPVCDTCARYFGTREDPHPLDMAPRHKASTGCESGSRPHCTCPICWG